MDSTQGPHQVAQNSTRYALPGSKLVTGSPCIHLPLVNLGAGSPSLRVGAGAAGGALESTLGTVDGPETGDLNDVVGGESGGRTDGQDQHRGQALELGE